MIIEIISMSLAAFSVGFVASFTLRNFASSKESKPIVVVSKKKLSRSPHKRRLWTDSEEDALRSLVSKKYRNKEISKLLGRPATSIVSKKKELNLVTK